MILLFIYSIALSGGTVVILYLILSWFIYPNFHQFRPFIMLLYEKVGALPIAMMMCALLFILYVILLSHRSVRFLVQITKAVQRVSKGNLDTEISIQSTDELGELAHNINIMTKQLKVSMEEERAAVQAKNELITNVSHDLRTPLTSIIGYMRLVEEDRYKDEVELRYYINIAYEKSQRLNRLVDDLFDYTRMSHGNIQLNYTQINLIELLAQLAAEFDLPLRHEQMEVHLQFMKENITITADGDKLMRVFENLLSNAMKYGKSGKRIDIRAKLEPGWAIVQMVNYGPVIPATELAFIFDRFYRVDKSRSGETGGTGLGLAIAKSIIEQHYGTIQASSGEQETVFEVKLPLSQPIKQKTRG